MSLSRALQAGVPWETDVRGLMPKTMASPAPNGEVFRQCGKVHAGLRACWSVGTWAQDRLWLKRNAAETAARSFWV
eukprot:2759605-Pyramimonas_sp.AAC.1